MSAKTMEVEGSALLPTIGLFSQRLFETRLEEGLTSITWRWPRWRRWLLVAHCSFAAAEETVVGQICGVVEMPAMRVG